MRFRGLPAPGSFSYDPDTQSYSVLGGGSGIGGFSDHFHFVHRRLSGNGSITAKVESIDRTNQWARSGVMIRQTLDHDSMSTLCSVTAPGNQNRARFEYRRLPGGGSDAYNTPKKAITVPHWVRLTRSGNTFTGEHSADGITWEAFLSEDVVMDTDVYIGLAVTAQNTSVLGEAVFSHVSITGNVTPAGQFSTSTDIGIDSTNLEGQLYVTIEDSAGVAGVVRHPDLNATQQTQWQEWPIDLKVFSDVGVNLQGIKKISIGVGDRANPTPGSAGTLYFDDLRLYPAPDPDSTGN